MSHGTTAGDKCEPNLVPLLDLVLQLIMFFMVCANFVIEQTNVEIKLPQAIAAKALQQGDKYVIYLNVNQKGEVLLAPTEQYVDTTGNRTSTLNTAAQVGVYLRRRAKEDREAGGPGNKDQALRSVIILRVHEDCPFDKTYAIMKECRAAGYLRVQLRAILAKG